MSAPSFTYDGIISFSHFLHQLYDRCYPQTPSAWIKAVYRRLEGEALEWAKNDEDVARIQYNVYHNVAIDSDGRGLYQLLNERFATSLSSRVDKVLKGIKQERHESIKSYYTRVNTLFEHVGGQDGGLVDEYLDYEHGQCLFKVIDWFVEGLRNTKLRRDMVKILHEVSAEGNAAAVSLESICNAAQWAYTTIKRARKLRNQLFDTDTSIVIDMSQSCLEETTCNLPEISTSIYPPAHTSKSWLTQNERAQASFETGTVYESPPVLEQIQPEISETSTDIVDPSDTESADEILASGPRKWPTPITTLSETTIVYESQPILEETPCSLSEINATTVDSSDIEPMDEILASGPGKWPAPITTLPETIAVYESPPVLEEMSCNLSEISTATEDSSDTESIDEILASGLRKWTTALAAEKEVFDSTVILHATPKNQPAPHIEKDTCIEAVGLNNAPAKSIVDVETLGQEVFALAALFDIVSKNPPTPYSEDTEISAAVEMPSHEHLTHEDGSAIETFDSDTALGAPSENPLTQHIEDLETLEKDSVYIYELPAIPAFDLSIDIDFAAYTTDSVVTNSVIQAPVTSPRRKMQLSPFRGLALRNKSFGWSRSSNSSIGRRTSSISTCTTISSDVTLNSIETAKTEDIVDTDCYEGEQLSCSMMYPSVPTSIEYITESGTNFYEEEQSCCFDKSFVSVSVDCVVSEHSDFYGGEQYCSPVDDTVDIDDIVDVIVIRTDAHTLTAGMVKKKKESDWTSLLGLILLLAWAWIEYLVTSKHKGLPKVKIKRYQNRSISNQEVNQSLLGYLPKSAYKIALFSGMRQRLGPLR